MSQAVLCDNLSLMSEENKTGEIKLYELGYHLTPAISEDKVSVELDEIKKILTDNGAEIVKEGEPKLMTLAYEIITHIAGKNQKFDKAYFGWVKFNASADVVEKIKELLDSKAEIIRSLITKTVDDDEHSTAKILDEEEAKKKEEEDNEESKEDISEEAEEEKVEETKEEVKDDGLDEELDSIVEEAGEKKEDK